MSKLLPLTRWVVFVMALFGLFCSSPSKESKEPVETAPVLHVKVSRVIRDSIALPLCYPGKLTTATELRLGFKTGGIIRNVFVDEGTVVKKGVLLAVLDTVEISAWLDKAHTALEKAQRDRARTLQLYNDSVATHEQLQNAESAYRAAKADVEIARYNSSQSTLIAPAGGKVLKRLAEKNEVIGPGVPVVIVASTDEAWQVKASVPDIDLSLLTIGDSVQVRFDALPGKVFSALLSKIAPAAHPVSGTFEIEIDLLKRDASMRYGLFADIKIYPTRQKSLDFIPATALASANGMSGVVIAAGDDNIPKLVPITIERMFGDWVAVSEGLSTVKEVVTSGAAYVLSTNDKIVFDR